MENRPFSRPAARRIAVPRISYTANGPWLCQLRSEHNLTQATLAGISRLSDRVVRKAEAGEPVDWGTIVTLANALRVHDPHTLLFDPTKQAQLLLKKYAQYGPNTVENVSQYLDRHVEVDVSGEGVFPFGGTFYGPTGLDQYLENVESVFYRRRKPFRCDLNVAQHNKVVIRAFADMKGRQEGSRFFEAEFLMIFTFNNGKLVSFSNHFDTRQFHSHLNVCAEWP
jgi:hypothetical protein